MESMPLPVADGHSFGLVAKLPFHFLSLRRYREGPVHVDVVSGRCVFTSMCSMNEMVVKGMMAFNCDLARLHTLGSSRACR
jgi:hypothetical protein